jgi:hypothetical protein
MEISPLSVHKFHQIPDKATATPVAATPAAARRILDEETAATAEIGRLAQRVRVRARIVVPCRTCLCRQALTGNCDR